MIVLLDTQKLMIKIYAEDGLQTLTFDNASMLRDIIGDKPVFYVTNGMAATADQITATVNSFMAQHAAPKVPNEPMFLRTTQPGAMNIPGLYNRLGKKKEDLIFFDPFDAKPLLDILRAYGKDVFETSPTMRTLLKTGKLQIIAQSDLEDLKNRTNMAKGSKSSSEKKLEGQRKAAKYSKYLRTHDGDVGGVENPIELGEIRMVGGGGSPSRSMVGGRDYGLHEHHLADGFEGEQGTAAQALDLIEQWYKQQTNQ